MLELLFAAKVSFFSMYMLSILSFCGGIFFGILIGRDTKNLDKM
jgi:hypothetical protein